MSSGRKNNLDEQIVCQKNLQKEFKQYKNAKSNKSWIDFEQYVDCQTRMWQISFHEVKEEWQSKSNCNCSSFQKNYICKHLLLQAIRLKFVEVPLTAKTVDLEDKPKRGRPKTVSKALKIDPPLSIVTKKSKRATSSKQDEPINKRSKAKK